VTALAVDGCFARPRTRARRAVAIGGVGKDAAVGHGQPPAGPNAVLLGCSLVHERPLDASIRNPWLRVADIDLLRRDPGGPAAAGSDRHNVRSPGTGLPDVSERTRALGRPTTGLDISAVLYAGI
jgi:hypothetical protein